MTFFNGFPEILYKFGNEKFENSVQNISVYVDVLEAVKENSLLYNTYNVIGGERPDQISQKLYGTPDYYWTFYLINDDIQLKGWPLSDDELNILLNKKFPNTVVVTRDYFYDKFKVGDTVRGQTSNVSAVVTNTRSDLGQFTVAGNVTFTDGETIEKVGATHNTVTLFSSGSEVNATKYYSDSTGIVDIDPTIGPGAQLTETTNKDFYFMENENLKSIKVIKPGAVVSIFNAYKSGLRENA
jgi:hypothetical protein